MTDLYGLPAGATNIRIEGNMVYYDIPPQPASGVSITNLTEYQKQVGSYSVPLSQVQGGPPPLVSPSPEQPSSPEEQVVATSPEGIVVTNIRSYTPAQWEIKQNIIKAGGTMTPQAEEQLALGLQSQVRQAEVGITPEPFTVKVPEGVITASSGITPEYISYRKSIELQQTPIITQPEKMIPDIAGSLRARVEAAAQRLDVVPRTVEEMNILERERTIISFVAQQPQTKLLYEAETLGILQAPFKGLVYGAASLINPAWISKIKEYEWQKQVAWTEEYFQAYKSGKLLEKSIVTAGLTGAELALIAVTPSFLKGVGNIPTIGKYITTGIGATMVGAGTVIGIEGYKKAVIGDVKGLEEISFGGMLGVGGAIITRAGWKQMFPIEPKIKIEEVGNVEATQRYYSEEKETVGLARQKTLISAGKQKFTAESIADYSAIEQEGAGQIATGVKELKTGKIISEKDLFAFREKDIQLEGEDLTYLQTVYGKAEGVKINLATMLSEEERSLSRTGIKMALGEDTKLKGIETLTTKTTELTTPKEIITETVSVEKGKNILGAVSAKIRTFIESPNDKDIEIFKPSVGSKMKIDVKPDVSIVGTGLKIGGETAKSIVKELIIPEKPSFAFSGIGAIGAIKSMEKEIPYTESGKIQNVNIKTKLETIQPIISVSMQKISQIEKTDTKQKITPTLIVDIKTGIDEEQLKSFGLTRTPITSQGQKRGQMTLQQEELKTMTDIIVPNIPGINIPVGGIPVNIVPFPDIGFYDDRKFNAKMNKINLKTKYKPSLQSIGEGIFKRGKPPKIVSGIENRPIYLPYKRKVRL